MLSVTVELAGALRDLAGTKETIIELANGGHTGDVLERLGVLLPQLVPVVMGDGLGPPISIFVNDRLVPEVSLRSWAVSDGDKVLLILPIAGG